MREVVSQCPYSMGQSQINGDAKDRKSRDMSFTQGEARLLAKLNLNTRICAVWSEPKDLQQQKTQSAWYAFSLCREQNNHFLVHKQ